MEQNKDRLDWHGTTIVLIRKGNDVVVAGEKKETSLQALQDQQRMRLHYLKD